jgi:putative phosphoribosyl transferase
MSAQIKFQTREAAGKKLATALARLNLVDPVVLALPRGGIPVAAPCAERLRAPLDLLMVRKIGVPGQAELAAAAIVDGAAHEIVLNEDVMQAFGLQQTDLQATIDRELAEIKRRRTVYLGSRKPVEVGARSVIVVDDGIATGTTLAVAIKALRRRTPHEIIVAMPLAPAEALQRFQHEADRVICLEVPEPFISVGSHYADFHAVSDAEVMAHLDKAAAGANQVPVS